MSESQFHDELDKLAQAIASSSSRCRWGRAARASAISPHAVAHKVYRLAQRRPRPPRVEECLHDLRAALTPVTSRVGA